MGQRKNEIQGLGITYIKIHPGTQKHPGEAIWELEELGEKGSHGGLLLGWGFGSLRS